MLNPRKWLAPTIGQRATWCRATGCDIALMINGAYITGQMAESADLRGDLVDAVMKLSA
jgi:hypothetical protein